LILIGALAAPASADDGKPQGFYSNMEPAVEQGSLIGTEVFVLPYVDGDEVRYVALVQFADGVPLRPQLVDVRVEGRTLSFPVTHPELGEVRYSGTLDEDGLTGSFGADDPLPLPRGESIWQWGSDER
jgi:hypothetical protein